MPNNLDEDLYKLYLWVYSQTYICHKADLNFGDLSLKQVAAYTLAIYDCKGENEFKNKEDFLEELNETLE